jgi:uncharacterized membrane protein required for colicin V production
MPNTTDTVIRLILIYFALRGFFKGFIAILIGPISLVLGLIISFSYYSKTHDLIKTSLVGILGPIIINLCLSLAFKVWKVTFAKDESPSLTSRFAGAAFSVLWGGAYLAMFLFFIAMVPPSFPKLGAIQQNVSESQSYHLVKEWTRTIKPLAALTAKIFSRH